MKNFVELGSGYFSNFIYDIYQLFNIVHSVFKINKPRQSQTYTNVKNIAEILLKITKRLPKGNKIWVYK